MHTSDSGFPWVGGGSGAGLATARAKESHLSGK